MKRITGLLILALFVVGAVSYGLTRITYSRQHWADTPLVLDATTKAILAGADRVETFRLVDFHEEENYNDAERDAAFGKHSATLNNHSVLHTGAPQGRDFAVKIGAAVSTLKTPSSSSLCFDPGVGFRVWKGQAHTDLCVCFYCSGVEIVTKDARHKEVFHQRAELGESRPAFLALAKRAFPQDSEISALPLQE